LIFLSGDLNYRIDQRRENVIASIEAGDLEYLLEHDQLRKEMKNNPSFRLRAFKEDTGDDIFPPLIYSVVQIAAEEDCFVVENASTIPSIDEG
jgi:hypothetical protein